MAPERLVREGPRDCRPVYLNLKDGLVTHLTETSPPGEVSLQLFYGE